MTNSELEDINAIKEDDLNKINLVLLQSFYINNISLVESDINYKEDMIDGFADLLKKMLTLDSEMSKESRLIVINLLDKLNTQKEKLEMIKLKTNSSDIHQASERLSKKSQSAFPLK